MNKVCIVGASGKLGRYMIQHALERGYEVVGVCREESLPKLDDLKDRISIIGGRTNDREVIRRGRRGLRRGTDGSGAVGYGPLLIGYGTGRSRFRAIPGPASSFPAAGILAVTERTGTPVFFLVTVKIATYVARIFRLVDIDDQVEACRRIFASDTQWDCRPWERP